MHEANYTLNLYLNGTLIGDCRELAQNLTWTRRRTKLGADSVDFTINDVLFAKWCENHHTTLGTILKPLALECRLYRNNVPIVGGFLATMPAYQPLNASANLQMRFDGFLNLLDGVYIRNLSTSLPYGTVSMAASSMVQTMISLANTVSSNAGKGYGFIANHIDTLSSITNTFDNYKTVKEWICERCDNTSGAGIFDVYFYPDKKYDIWADANFGDTITDWVAYYPTLLDNTSITSISADEVEGFASAALGLGAGEISSNADEDTVLRQFAKYDDAIAEFGYKETIYQDSSISNVTTLRRNMYSELNWAAYPIWRPQITLHGRQVAPTPSGAKKIWLGDRITIKNSADSTGMTNGLFRVNELKVAVSAAGDETITPVLERIV